MTTLMEYLLACNILDIVTGFIKAYDQKNVSSKKMKHGALSKISIWCVIVVSIMVSGYLKSDITSYVVGYYLVMEVVSILENVSVFIPVPDKIKNMLSTVETKENAKTDAKKDAKETVTTVEPQTKIDSRIFDEIKKKEDD